MNCIDNKIVEYYRKNLNLDNTEAMQYLTDRGLYIETIEKFKLGYAKNKWTGLCGKFDNNEELLEIGLIGYKKNEKGFIFYDVFRGRLMFPIFNDVGNVIAFGGRTLLDDNIKYLNSKDSYLYNKSRVLYGLNFAKQSIREEDFVILVEGYMDVISLVDKGIENVVASSGTSLTQEQIDLIKRYTDNIYLCYDNDEAGMKALKRSLIMILENDLNPFIIKIPTQDDPDSYINKFGKGKFQELIDHRTKII